MIPLKIRQKLSYIKNRIEKYDFNTEQINRINEILNKACYELDYSLVVEKVKRKK
jgi:hypothetical protein